MTSLQTTITLKSTKAYGQRLPPGIFGAFLENLGPVSRQSVRMAFQRRSVSPGRVPGWLSAASDVRFVGHDAADDGDTVLMFEAPPLGEAAEELYRQQELWPQRPASDDTALDLLADVVTAVAAEDRDSDRFDAPLLRALGAFSRSLNGEFTAAAIHAPRVRETPAVLDSRLVQAARSLGADAPRPRRIRIVGRLDMIRASTQTFALKLEDGTELNGILSAGGMGALASLFEEQVLVRGNLVYKPSGRPLRVDAETVEGRTGEPGLWSRLPVPGLARPTVATLRRPQGRNTGVAAVIGQWPGDETEEEVAEALERVS